MTPYQISLQNSTTYQIGLPRSSVRNLTELEDVDRFSKRDGYVLVWNATTERHEYISPFEVLDRADEVNDDSLDYGTY
jgi:hypothetical protein